MFVAIGTPLEMLCHNWTISYVNISDIKGLPASFLQYIVNDSLQSGCVVSILLVPLL